jgi:membrane protein
LLTRTLEKAWHGSIFSEAAEAAFWQTLSLPPLLLGLLGSLGYVSGWFGAEILDSTQNKIITFSHTVFSDNVVKDIITPTVKDILRTGRGEVVSIGFLISLWAGSSAMSSFVDAITSAHDQYSVRNPVWQRIFALLLYMASLIGLIIGLPLLALGPGILPNFFPGSWRGQVTMYVNLLYYPALGVLALIAVTTLYKLALPRKLPWHRGVPGAVLAVVVFMLASSLLRLYISWITTTGYTYGALATPIALLLFTFFIGFATVLGAHFNAAIQEMWPARMTRRQRRRWRRLEMERIAEHIRAKNGSTANQSEPTPVDDRTGRPAGSTAGELP